MASLSLIVIISFAFSVHLATRADKRLTEQSNSILHVFAEQNFKRSNPLFKKKWEIKYTTLLMGIFPLNFFANYV